MVKELSFWAHRLVHGEWVRLYLVFFNDGANIHFRDVNLVFVKNAIDGQKLRFIDFKKGVDDLLMLWNVFQFWVVLNILFYSGLSLGNFPGAAVLICSFSIPFVLKAGFNEFFNVFPEVFLIECGASFLGGFCK